MLILSYGLQQELNDVMRDHRDHRHVNVQTSWHTTLTLFMSNMPEGEPCLTTQANTIRKNQPLLRTTLK